MKNRSLDLLKYQPFPALAGAVRDAAATIIGRWQDLVRQTLPAANELTLKQLNNSLPQILQVMADALEADEPKPTKDLMDESVSHGETRYDQDFALNELMIEYSLLRRVLVEEVDKRLPHDITAGEVAALNLGVDVACRRGVVTFANAQKGELQAVVEAQTKYLSFLSHDLRGGLNGVLLMIEVLRRDLATEPKFANSLEDLDVMRRSILETVGTMDRFLHAERFRKGKVQVRPARVVVKNVMRDVVGHYAYHARDKQLQLAEDVADGLEAVTDRELLTLILQNLLGNAVKYSRRGTIRLIARPAAPGNGVCCRLSVVDQGPGIAEERLSQLFSSFTRGETHGQQGSGLGLSIARQASDLLGARLWAESKVGEGSAFHLELPTEPPKAEAKA